MTLKVQKMTSKKKSKTAYPQISFYIEEYPNCCGIDVIVNVDDYEEFTDDEEWPMSNGEFPSLAACHRDFYKRLLAQRSRTFMQMAVVSKYLGRRLDGPNYTGQNTPLLNFLIKDKKWNVLSVFKNSNTGNEVTVIGKTFPKKRLSKVSGGIFNTSWSNTTNW